MCDTSGGLAREGWAKRSWGGGKVLATATGSVILLHALFTLVTLNAFTQWQWGQHQCTSEGKHPYEAGAPCLCEADDWWHSPPQCNHESLQKAVLSRQTSGAHSLYDGRQHLLHALARLCRQAQHLRLVQDVARLAHLLHCGVGVCVRGRQGQAGGCKGEEG